MVTSNRLSPRTFPSIATVAALVALAAGVPAWAQAPPALPTPPPGSRRRPPARPRRPRRPRRRCNPTGGDICLSAERQEQLDKGHFQARGFVDLQFGDARIQADQLDMYETAKPDGSTARRDRGPGQRGLHAGEERMAGERLQMDLDTSYGVFDDAMGFVSPGVLVEGQKIERLDADTYRIEGGEVHVLHAAQPRAGASPPARPPSTWTTRSGPTTWSSR